MLVNSATPAVEADARSAVIVHHRRVVGVVNHRHVDVVHGAVVIKMVVLPSPAFIPVAKVAESIINPAIESHHRAPIAFVKVISPAAPGPIARRPKESRPRRQNPCSRHPVIIVSIPCPISWRPNVSLAWANWLFINRQFRRAERNGDSY